jgi:hypothetical protein
MKLGLLAVLLLIVSCAPPPPSRPGAGTYGGSTGGASASSTTSTTSNAGGMTGDTRPANSYGQDTVECERKAALSQAGSKGEAFANCMRSRGHSLNR